MLQKYKQYVITLLFILLALPIVQAQGKKIVVLLPGLGNKHDRQFTRIQKALAPLKHSHGLQIHCIFDFDEQVKMHFSGCTFWHFGGSNRYGISSYDYAIAMQAKMVYQVLKNELDIDKEDEMVIIGQSQGGLRGYSLLKQYGPQLNSSTNQWEVGEHGLNIKGLLTIGTPWKGAPIVDNGHKAQEYIKNTAPYLNELDEALKKFTWVRLRQRIFNGAGWKTAENLYDGVTEELQTMVNNLQNTENLGARDLSPTSTFIQQGKNKKIPDQCLLGAVIGKENDIFKGLLHGHGKILNTIRGITVVGCCFGSFRHLSMALANITAAKEENKEAIHSAVANVVGSTTHDCVVPVENQNPKNILSSLHDAHFKILALPDGCHESLGSLTGTDVLNMVGYRLAEYNHDKTLRFVKEFIQQAFQLQVPAIEIEEVD